MSRIYGQKITVKMGNPVKCSDMVNSSKKMETGISAYTEEQGLKSSLIGVTSQCSTSYFLSPNLQLWNFWLGELNHPAYYDSIRSCLCSAACNHHNTLQLNPFWILSASKFWLKPCALKDCTVSASIYLLNQKQKFSSEMNYLFTDSLNNAPVGSKVVIT